MATYIVLIDWTEKGVGSFRESVSRYEAAQSRFQGMGVTFRDTYWTLGGHDVVAILDAPDDETLAAALLTLGSQGNLRTTTMRGFSVDEMRAVIAKAG